MDNDLKIFYYIMLVTFCCVVWISANRFSSALLLLVKVPLIVFLYYGLCIDMFLPLSQLVALGKNHKHY